MGGDLALVVALIAFVGVLDEQLPVVGQLIVERVPGVAAVRVLAERNQV